MANRNFANGGRIYAMHVKPVIVNTKFTVTAANGLGITNLKGPTVQNVFMHTSTTPAAGNRNPASPNVAVVNPNPAAGTIVVQLQDPYTAILAAEANIISPNSGSGIVVTAAGAHLVAGTAYVITVVGTTTAAQWASLGVPAGIVPAVGVSFISGALTGVGTGTGQVQISAAAGSGLMSIELVGDPTLTSSPNAAASQGYGAQLIFQCRDKTGALAAPADGSTIAIKIYINDSKVPTQI